MKSRILAVLCAVVFTAGTLAGCGSASSDTKKDNKEETEVTELSEEEAAEAGFDDGAVISDDADAKEETDAEDEESTDDQDSEEEDFTSESADTEDDKDTEVLDTSSELTGIHHAEISIEDYGTLEVELDADTAPITVTNFVKLAQDGFYDGLTFWRIMDGFMIQGGDPKKNGTGGSDETIKGEFSNNGVENNISHTRGVISMARATDPDSASSQFFIVQADSEFLDGDYAAFGEVTEGMDIVDEICKDANPTDDNGTIKEDEQPVIETITILD